MSGKPYKGGLPVFSITGSGTLPRRATRRQRANSMLIAHRERGPRTNTPYGAPLEQWIAWQSWNLAWEAAIIRYRDGNDNNEGTSHE